MIKASLLSVFLFFILTPVSLQGQSITGNNSGPFLEAYYSAMNDGTDPSEVIKNEPKSKESTFFLFEWLFGSPKPRQSRAEEVTQSEIPDGEREFTRPESNSENPVFYERKDYPNTTKNAGFIQNDRSKPIKPSLRDQHLKIGGWDLGLSVGSSHSITDVQNNKNLGFVGFMDYQTSNFSYSFGAFTRYKAADWFNLAGGINYARLSGSGTIDDPGINQDFLSFENNLLEFLIKAEFYATFLRLNYSDVYLYTGVSAFLNDVVLEDAQGDSQPLANDYIQLQPAQLIGLGYSYNFDNGISIGYEVGWRYTLFNYLDGVKIDKDKYDSYFLNSITISYPLK